MCLFDNYEVVVVEFASYFLPAFSCSSLLSNTLRQRRRSDKVPSPSCASKVLPRLFYCTVCGTQTATVHVDSPFGARHRVRQGLCFSVGCPLACTPSARGGTAPRKVAPDEGKTSANIRFRGVTKHFLQVDAVFATCERYFCCS